MDVNYQRLGVTQAASLAEIETAYLVQRERYTPEKLATLPADLRAVAEERAAQLEAAYATARARALGSETPSRARHPGVSRRELVLAAIGAIVGLLVVGVVWVVTAQSAPPPGVAVGEVNRPAPAFTLTTLDGKQVSLSAYRGRPVLVNFWGTWCEPCKEETPALQAAYERVRADGGEIIGVNLRRQESGDAVVRAFAKQYGVTYPIALDVDGNVAEQFQISPIPTSYFIDGTGTIRFVRVGTLTTDEVVTLFETLRQASRS